MRLIIAAVGQKMPHWVNDGFSEYRKRMPGHLRLDAVEVPMPRRGRNARTAKLVETEAAALKAALPGNCLRIALDARGKQWSTKLLAQQIEQWQHDGRDIGFMIGGPDGLAPELVTSADVVWSLGSLTLPHPLVRVILAEQLYRAWTITVGHPYHRE